MDSLRIKYPIYIVSKGRWDNFQTPLIFMKEKIPFKIAVEPQEYDKYLEKIPKENILKLDFSNLGLGSYPARNYCWQDSIKNDFAAHFIFDDNIKCFSRLNHGKRKRTNALEALLCLQNFYEKYENLAIAGYNYRYFVTNETNKPFFLNTHVYSGMLIRNDIKPRWRLKYNEDVDLCLQILSAKKMCTILLNVYLIDKTSTASKMKGGNQDELYKGNDPYKKALKARSLEQLWPQYVKTVYRFNRPHHQVSWNKFFNHALIRKKVKLNGKEIEWEQDQESSGS